MSKDKARMMLFDEKIVDKLLNILAAFKDEPESGERLRLYSPKYDSLLEETLSFLATFGMYDKFNLRRLALTLMHRGLSEPDI